MENNALIALMMATCAGSATMLGAMIAVLFRPSNKILCVTLAFSAGGMISVSILELLQNAIETIKIYMPATLGMVALFFAFLVGVLAGAVLNIMLPKGDNENHSLFRVGLLSMIAMILHNIPEGIAVFLSGYTSPSLGVSMAFAIAVHNIPEGLAIAMPVYASKKGIKVALMMAFLASLAEPIGALLAWLFLAPFITQSTLSLLFAGIAGLMLYISVVELFPTAVLKGSRWLAIVSSIVGFLVTMLLLDVTSTLVH